MAKQVQQRRGSTAEHASFTGAVGEITCDTTKDTAVVHDGSTAGGHPLALEKNVPNGSNSSITDDGTNVGIGTSNPTHKLDVSEQATFRGGITFNGDTSSTNALDDYEEGTWTPTIQSGTISVSSAKYTKIGKLVHLQCVVVNISDITSSAQVEIRGLPFTPSSAGQAVGSTMISYSGATTDKSVPYVGGSSNIVFFAGTASNGYYTLRHSELTSGSAAIHMNATYYAS